MVVPSVVAGGPFEGERLFRARSEVVGVGNGGPVRQNGVSKWLEFSSLPEMATHSEIQRARSSD